MTSAASLVCLNLVFLAIGAIALRLIVPHHCESLLSSIELQCNDTLNEKRRQYTIARQDHHTCLEQNDRCLVEIGELQARFEGKEICDQKYQLLLEQHQQMTEKFLNLEAESKEREEELWNQQQSAIRQRDGLKNQLDSKLEEMDFTLEGNKEIVDELGVVIREQKEDSEKTKRRIQQRNNVLCKEKYKNGPYYVHFSISIEGHRNQSAFVVEIPSRLQLPHSVFTFLSLIDDKLYDGFSVSFRSNNLVFELDPKSEAGSMLINNYKARGFPEAALSFIEASSMFRCKKNSIGFIGHGPSLRVITAPADNGDNIYDNVCFGKVVRGTTTLSFLREEVERGSSIRVDEANYLKLQ
eukprot:scaffold22577_cov122-Cylindrotheca_fusiformis.AAC.53